MGIDGINRPGGISPPFGADAPSGVEGEFALDEAPRADAAASSSSLEALGRGELTLDQYLEQRVEDAVRHLDGRVSNEQLDFVRETLREQLNSDPGLVELVRRATGATP